MTKNRLKSLPPWSLHLSRRTIRQVETKSCGTQSDRGKQIMERGEGVLLGEGGRVAERDTE